MRMRSKAMVPIIVGMSLVSVVGTAAGAATPKTSSLSQAETVVRAAEEPPSWAQYEPSTPAPPFQRGKLIAIVNGNAASSGADLQAKGVEDAAAVAGWKVIQFNGEGTDTGKISAFEQALALHPAGVVLVAIDERIVTDPMAAAHEAGIPVVSTMAGNVQGKKASEVYADLSAADLQTGVAVGDWIITDAASRHVTANIIRFEYENNNTVIHRDEGVSDALSKCSSCNTLDTVQYSSANLAQLSADVAPAIEAHPTVNYIVIDIGAYATDVVQAIQALGGSFASNIKLISFDCVTSQIADIKAGTVQAACDGQASLFSGWGAIDELNRALHHEPALVEHVPSMLITQANAAPVTNWTGFDGGFNFSSDWRQFWRQGRSR